MNVNNSKADFDTFLKISTNSRSDQIQRLEITSDIIYGVFSLSFFQAFSLEFTNWLHIITHTQTVYQKTLLKRFIYNFSQTFIIHLISGVQGLTEVLHGASE